MVLFKELLLLLLVAGAAAKDVDGSDNNLIIRERRRHNQGSGSGGTDAHLKTSAYHLPLSPTIPFFFYSNLHSFSVLEFC